MKKSERDKLRVEIDEWWKLEEGFEEWCRYRFPPRKAKKLLDYCDRLEDAMKEIAEGRGWGKGEESGEVIAARQALEGSGE